MFLFQYKNSPRAHVYLAVKAWIEPRKDPSMHTVYAMFYGRFSF